MDKHKIAVALVTIVAGAAGTTSAAFGASSSNAHLDAYAPQAQVPVTVFPPHPCGPPGHAPCPK